MDDSEKMAEIYLRNIGFTDVHYEPDGNIPPDFLVDNRIAIEVRRLNQNYDDGTDKGFRGLEEVAISLSRRIRNYLAELGPAPISQQSWYVFYTFSRPLPAWKELKCQLDTLLKPFMAVSGPEPFEAKIGDNFTIDVRPSGISRPTFFVPGGYIDEEAGGWLIEEIDRNLQHCITEKSNKIAMHRAKYKEWWLLLIDHIGYGLDEFDRKIFREQVIIKPCVFDKIILIDPRDASHFYEAFP